MNPNILEDVCNELQNCINNSWFKSSDCDPSDPEYKFEWGYVEGLGKAIDIVIDVIRNLESEEEFLSVAELERRGTPPYS